MSTEFKFIIEFENNKYNIVINNNNNRKSLKFKHILSQLSKLDSIKDKFNFSTHSFKVNIYLLIFKFLINCYF
jgi:hypothetical protein